MGMVGVMVGVSVTVAVGRGGGVEVGNGRVNWKKRTLHVNINDTLA
jgi:hypothetical protein